MTPETATKIAIDGLQYLAGDTEQLSRFVALTGMAPNDMRNAAASPEFLAAILDFYLGGSTYYAAFADFAAFFACLAIGENASRIVSA